MGVQILGEGPNPLANLDLGSLNPQAYWTQRLLMSANEVGPWSPKLRERGGGGKIEIPYDTGWKRKRELPVISYVYI